MPEAGEIGDQEGVRPTDCGYGLPGLCRRRLSIRTLPQEMKRGFGHTYMGVYSREDGCVAILESVRP